DDFASAMQSLDSMDQAYVDLYSKRTGLDKQEIYCMMCATTWMNAKQAVDKGFADSIMFENDQAPAVVNAYGIPVLSNSAIRKIKELIHEKSDDDSKPIKNKQDTDKGQAKKDLSLLLWQ
ncbi:ATP-dependent Clp protease proteolytic subunit, partial [Lactobacillus crispatus]